MFKSIVWSSTIDYPEQVSTVLFVGACNWNCEYCYNTNLINNPSISFEKIILPKLLQRKSFINHIIISGGECTCYKELMSVIKLLKENGFIVGIHTNGSNIKELNQIISYIDFVGMDIKTGDWYSYEAITKSKINFFDIMDSVKLIIESSKEYEFRTTIYPELVTKKHCIDIAKSLKSLNANKYVLQQYDNTYCEYKVRPYSIDYIKEIQKDCNKIIPTIIKGW